MSPAENTLHSPEDPNTIHWHWYQVPEPLWVWGPITPLCLGALGYSSSKNKRSKTGALDCCSDALIRLRRIDHGSGRIHYETSHLGLTLKSRQRAQLSDVGGLPRGCKYTNMVLSGPKYCIHNGSWELVP